MPGAHAKGPFGRLGLIGLIALTGWIAGGCGPGEPEPDSAETPTGLEAPAPADPPPRVELGGCRHIDGDRACVLEAGTPNTVHLWVDAHAELPLELRVDGARVTPTIADIDGGQRLTIELEPGAAGLRVEVANQPGAPRWTGPLEVALRYETIPAVVGRALEDARSGEPERLSRARASLEQARTELDGPARLAALQLLRKLSYGTPEGDALIVETAALAEALGRPRELADSASAGAYLAIERDGDLVAARAWVERLSQAKAPEAVVWRHYYGGLLEARTGNLGAAAKEFEAASIHAARLDMLRDYLGASEMHASVLAQLNRGAEALASVRAVTEVGRRPEVRCRDRARALTNAGWTNLVLAEAGFEHDPPEAMFIELLGLVEPGGSCPDPTIELVARINLALAAIAEHEYEDAEAWLESLPETVSDRLRGSVAMARDRVALETGRHERLPALGSRPRAHRELGAYWTDAVLEAETCERFGQLGAAEEAYRRAEAILDEASSTLGVDVGRELFLAGRAASVEGLVTLLVDQGRADEALCSVRLARARELRAADQSARIAKLSPEGRRARRGLLERYISAREDLAAERREDWRYSAPQREQRRQRRREREAPLDALLDEALGMVGQASTPPTCESLARPRPGELLLVPFEGRQRGWLFAATETTVEVADLGPGNGDARERFAAALSAPVLLDRLEAASELRILAGGSAASQSLHALSVAGAPVLARAPTSYSLDLPARAEGPPRPRVAVVVANPSSDLAEAEAEAAAVAALLRDAGWEVRHRVGPEATRARLREDLGEVALLHYAGHGVHRGASGWDAALLLGEDDTISVTDVLALSQVPELVVLTGCETATVSDQAFAGGMNLARAFVLAGARWVVAADGAVDDALAREVGERLHAHLNGADLVVGTPAAALREVVSSLRARDEDVDWDRFRLLVP